VAVTSAGSHNNCPSDHAVTNLESVSEWNKDRDVLKILLPGTTYRRTVILKGFVLWSLTQY